MKVRILRTGNYLDPDRLPQHKAKQCEEGEVVEFPLDYAEGINASRLAKEFIPLVATIEAEQEEELVDATNGAMALAEELGIDLATVQGSGAGGRIIMRDVEKLE